MTSTDVIVIGGGISGLSFAFHAARAGKRVHLYERAERIGGCLHTEAAPDDFWIELGGHTCYNSYGAFIEVLEGLGLMGELQPRGKSVLRYIEGNAPLPGSNLGALLSRMNLFEAALSIPRLLTARQKGSSVKEYYGALVGPGNYARVLGPMLSAVPSQSADEIPADMLFKSRPRRKDVLRSFTLKRGLGEITEPFRGLTGLSVHTGRGARAIEATGDGYSVVLEDGTRQKAAIVAVATTPVAASKLLAGAAPAASAAIRDIEERTVHSVGVVVPKNKVSLPYATFFIPTGDVFHSIVTRDVVDHPKWRGFVFHFKPDLDPEMERARISQVLRLPAAELERVVDRTSVMPSPTRGHHERTRALDAALAGTRLAVTGNYFAGLAIEDCVQRSRHEWRRVAQVS